MVRPVLVTGAGGFIGRHIVRALLRSGRRVRALVRRDRDAAELRAEGAEPVIGDLLDVERLSVFTADVSAIFHLAGQLFVPGKPAAEFMRLHVDVTLGLLKACEGIDALEAFVLCSTTGVHGPTGTLRPREDDSPKPSNAYETSKARAEQDATLMAQRLGLPLTIARPGLVYGPGDRHLLGLFRAIQDGFYRIIGPGTNQYHPVYIDDVVTGLLLLSERGSTDGRSYHLVGPRPVSMSEFSDAIGKAVGRRVSSTHLPQSLAYAVGAALEWLPISRRALPLSRSRVLFMTQNRAYDGARARQELGFAPRVELEEGLARTVTWYREHNWL